MIRFASLCSSVALALSIATPAFADASSDLYRAIDRTEAAHSYHLVMTSARGSFAGDYIYPATMHVTMAGMEMININGKMYLRRGTGEWQAIPGGMGATDVDALQTMKLNRADYRASDLGMRLADGKAMHEYHVDNLKTGRAEFVYVDASGRVARVDAPTLTVRFSRFGQPAHIVAPI
jgi:hypothetical protein